MGKSTISMTIFNSKLLVYQAGYIRLISHWITKKNIKSLSIINLLNIVIFHSKLLVYQAGYVMISPHQFPAFGHPKGRACPSNLLTAGKGSLSLASHCLSETIRTSLSSVALAWWDTHGFIWIYIWLVVYLPLWKNMCSSVGKPPIRYGFIWFYHGFILQLWAWNSVD